MKICMIDAAQWTIALAVVSANAAALQRSMTQAIRKSVSRSDLRTDLRHAHFKTLSAGSL